MSLNPDQMKVLRRQYSNASAEVSAVVADAMLTAYQNVTGHKPSDKFREAVFEVVEQNSI